MDKMKMETGNITERNIDKIAELFPNCITESPDGKGGLKKAVNFDLLRQMLSEDVVEGDEAYEFTWVGKKAAIVESNKPIRKTLRPCSEESVDWDHTIARIANVGSDRGSTKYGAIRAYTIYALKRADFLNTFPAKCTHR